MPYKNKEDQYASQRRWYQRNKKGEIIKAVTRKRKLRLKKKLWLIEQLGNSCQKCGYNKCEVSLDIHHTNTKSRDIGFEKSITDQSWKYLKEHLKDFTLLCANCHREHHYISQPL